MKISIIIPCLNQQQELLACINAISKQTFSSYEVIIIDGSKQNIDGFNFAKSALNIKYISEQDKNVYDAMNKGINNATGEWLYFMGVDDAFYDNTVLKTVTPYLNAKKVKLVLGQIIYNFDNSDSFILRRHKGLVKPIWSHKIWLRNTLPHQGIFYHCSVFKNEQYNINYSVLADYAFNLILWKNNTSKLILDKIIASCSTNGISKNYNFKLYKEEVNLKTRASSIFLKPLFIVLALAKNIIKKF